LSFMAPVRGRGSGAGLVPSPHPRPLLGALAWALFLAASK
jgi:hypothetical protein